MEAVSVSHKHIISRMYDFAFRVILEDPFVAPLGNGRFTLYSLKPPASGAILSYILRVLSNMLPSPNELVTTQRITEAFKYAYAIRGDLGDPGFVNVSPVNNTCD